MESGLLAIEIIKIVWDIRVSFVPIKVRKCLFNLHGIQPEEKKKQNFTGRKVSGFTLEQEIIILLWSLVLSELWIYENEHDLRSRMNNLSGWKRTWKNSGLTGNRTLTFVMTGRNALSIELINHVFIRRSKYDSCDIFQLISCLLVYESFYCCLPWPGNFFFHAHFKMAATYRCRLVTSIITRFSTGIPQKNLLLLPVKMPL